MARMSFETARAVILLAGAVAVAGCGGEKSSTFNGHSGSSVALSGNGGGGSGSLSSGSLSGGTPTILPDGAVVDSVPDPNCPNGGNTTVSGIVYDPALQNPLYNITVFIPNQLSDLPNLNSGASCAACADYYPANIVAAAGTDVHGHFTITRAAGGPAIPVGKNIPIVVQTGKWRMAFTFGEVTACQDNVAPDKTLRLPAKASEGNLPDIAISTGGADSLECLPLRIGIDSSEYVAGGAGPGHLHIFQGAGGATTTAGTPKSPASLWDSQADLMKNDVVLLSCEGAETTGVTTASRTDLQNYANSGGRVFASHFHYSWFNQAPFLAQNLAKWTPGANALDDNTFFPGEVVTTLNTAAGGTFPEGVALGQWLGVVNALDANGLLDIWFSRHNADVSTANTPSQPWIVLDKSSSMDPGATQYFSWDTPVGTAGAEQCGRIVYSDLHVSGGPGKAEGNVPPDYPMARGMQGGTVPDQCAMHPLTPQEKALEFMLFDLSSCLIPVGSPPVPPVTPK
jgi:hypothetical protein